jgi:predicted GNAT family acetyltransferase
MSTSAGVINNAAHRRFEIDVGGQIAWLSYAVRDGELVLIHTEVPKTLEGQGRGSALARTALEYATREHLRVVPRCPFVRGYLQRHPEYASLVKRE